MDSQDEFGGRLGQVSNANSLSLRALSPYHVFSRLTRNLR
jgi:hypothetical protein